MDPDTPATVAAMATNLLIPPVITTTSPSTGATGTFIDTTITITFSQEMDPSTFTTGDVRTTWNANKTYGQSDTVEYNGIIFTSNLATNKGFVPGVSNNWVQTTAAQTGAGTGTVRLKTGSTYLSAFTITYNSGSRQLIITPSSNLNAGTTYNVEIIGSNTASTANTSPVENTSGVPMALTFSFSFTTSATGATQQAGVVVSAAGGTVGLPSYTVAQLLLLSVTNSDAGSMAWVTNDYSSGSTQSTTAVYNGSNWVRVDNGTQITAPP